MSECTGRYMSRADRQDQIQRQRNSKAKDAHIEELEGRTRKLENGLVDARGRLENLLGEGDPFVRRLNNILAGEEAGGG